MSKELTGGEQEDAVSAASATQRARASVSCAWSHDAAVRVCWQHVQTHAAAPERRNRGRAASDSRPRSSGGCVWRVARACAASVSYGNVVCDAPATVRAFVPRPHEGPRSSFCEPSVG